MTKLLIFLYVLYPLTVCIGALLEDRVELVIVEVVLVMVDVTKLLLIVLFSDVMATLEGELAEDVCFMLLSVRLGELDEFELLLFSNEPCS